MQLSIKILQEQAGTRLDQMVSQSGFGISRSRAAQLISQGDILVNALSKRPGYKVKPGDLVEGDTGDLSAEDALPLLPDEHLPLSIIHEDDYILLVDKPAGLVVHPGAGNVSATLVNGLLAYCPGFSKPGWDRFRPGIVHRLDKDTSGLMVVAKTLKSHEFLQKEFKQRRVEKHYLAIVRGESIPDSGMIERPIGRHPRHRKRMAVLQETGRYAKTGFQVLERFCSGALVDVRLFTGRTHQIRVHFYDQGMPLFGDLTYQERRFRKEAFPAIPRQMLHSWTLSFRHPYSGIRCDFKAPVPQDFKTALMHLSDASLK